MRRLAATLALHLLLSAPAIGSDDCHKCVGRYGERVFGPCEESGGQLVPVACGEGEAPTSRRYRQQISMYDSAAPFATENYQANSSPKPTPERLALVARCERLWPADYAMQVHCIEKQTEAARTSSIRTQTLADDPEFVALAGRCALDWADGDTFDFEMVNHCIDTQLSAKARVDAERR